MKRHGFAPMWNDGVGVLDVLPIMLLLSVLRVASAALSRWNSSRFLMLVERGLSHGGALNGLRFAHSGLPELAEFAQFGDAFECANGVAS